MPQDSNALLTREDNHMVGNFEFDVALSFAGDNKRDKIREIANKLKERIQDGKVFFDGDFEYASAGLNADTYFQNVYGKESRLVVSCICKRYNEKNWTQHEWRAIRNFASKLGNDPVARSRFLPIRFDDGEVDGIFSNIDIALDVRDLEVDVIVELIFNRHSLCLGNKIAMPMTVKKDKPWQESICDFVVKGGKPLVGSIEVRGAKNVLPKLMIAALLSDDQSNLKNLSFVRDVLIVQKIIQLIGGNCQMNDESTMNISGRGLREAGIELLRNFNNLSRIPILLAAPLLHRFGRAIIPSLGGCELNGKAGRSIGFHLAALREMSVAVSELSNGEIELSCKKMRGGNIRLDYPSVGATELVLLCATVASGTTTLSNASLEPEVMELIDVLKAMGGIISCRENRQIMIQGNQNLRGFIHDALPDRSEIGSWACAAAATHGSVFIKGARPDGLEAFLDVFHRIGGDIEFLETGMRFSAQKVNLKPIHLESGPHPKFKTDWQPPLTAALTQADGESIIHETVFADRFGYTVTLNSMGARIELADTCPHFGVCRFAAEKKSHVARIFGASKLKPGTCAVADLRGGFSSLIGCLVADGDSTLLNSNWLSKGYDDIFGKLRALGVSVEQRQR